MKELWRKSFELFRRLLILWLPSLLAGVVMLPLAKLQRAAIRWLIGYFSTQHSVLGGEVASGDLTQAVHQTMMIIYPLGLLKQFLEVCLFVVALVTTKNLVQMILEEGKPAIITGVQAIVPRWRDVLIFSLKYMAGMAVFGGLLLVLTTSPLRLCA
jgi:hypothetical protein